MDIQQWFYFLASIYMALGIAATLLVIILVVKIYKQIESTRNRIETKVDQISDSIRALPAYLPLIPAIIRFIKKNRKTN